MRLRIRRNVDLPQPEGPINAVISPAFMVRETRSSTLWSPNQAVISRPSSSARATSPASGGVPSTTGRSWVLSIGILAVSESGRSRPGGREGGAGGRELGSWPPAPRHPLLLGDGEGHVSRDTVAVA